MSSRSSNTSLSSSGNLIVRMERTVEVEGDAEKSFAESRKLKFDDRLDQFAHGEDAENFAPPLASSLRVSAPVDACYRLVNLGRGKKCESEVSERAPESVVRLALPLHVLVG